MEETGASTPAPRKRQKAVSKADEKNKVPSLLKSPQTDVSPELSASEQKAHASRAKRKAGLAERFPMVRDRYRLIYGVPLTREILEEYIDECRKRELFEFLEAKLGRLTGTDGEIVEELLRE